MPEGDTVHKVAAALAPLLVGKRVVRSRLRHYRGDPLAGRTVEALEPLGKHLFIHLDGGQVLRSHLGLYGSWHRYRRTEPWLKPQRLAAIVLELDEEVLVCFNAKEVELLPSPRIDRRELGKQLGPDLIDHPDFDQVLRRARTLPPETPLTDVLLDQRVACGIGNIYKSELLFLERQSPARRLGDTPEHTLERLYRRAAALLRRNTAPGPRTTRFEADGRGRLWVYGRRAAPCLICGTPVAYRKMGRDMRSTYWCPRCQPMPETTTTAANVDSPNMDC